MSGSRSPSRGGQATNQVAARPHGTIHVVVAVTSSVRQIDHLNALASSLEALDLRSPEIDRRARDTRERLARTIRTYLIPRLEGDTGPLSVVFAGPTGSGKSTLVNSLSGRDVSMTGPIRPTTCDPVVLAGESAAPVLKSIGGVQCEVVIGRAPILDRMALVDTPDIDSTSTDHRTLAEILMDNADVLVFVTSALRYGDLVPWEVLRRALSRGTPVIHVLNRVTSDSGAAVQDFKSLLVNAGFGGEIIRVPEHHIGSGTHSVPALAVSELRRRLTGITENRDRYRQEVLQRVLMSTVDQAVALGSEVDSAAAAHEITETGIESLFDRRGLDLSGVDGSIGLTAPPGKGRLRRRLWLRKHRVSDEALSGYLDRVGSAIAGRVEADIGLTATTSRLTTEHAPVLARATRPVIDEAVQGWLGSVGERVVDVHPRDRNLATIAAISAAVDGEASDVSAGIFGLDGDATVGQAARTLFDRLEVAYGHAAGLALKRIRSSNGEASTSGLTESLADVVVTSHFADA